MKNLNLVASIVVCVGIMSQAVWAGKSCYQHYRAPLKEITYLINTDDLLSYTERGNPARAGIPAVWSSRAVLDKVLSLWGPLGPFGPASEYGPIGDNTWNPSFWWTKFFARSFTNLFSDKSMAKFDPLGRNGSLGDRGPLAKDWGEGAYSILGTTGILGPLGPLGALGIMGALQTRGLKGPDENGNYYYQGKIVKAVEIEWAEGKREFEIVEKYSSKEADRRSKEGSLENSFLVDSSMNWMQTAKSYRSKSDREKVISVLVIPDNAIMQKFLGLVPYAAQANFSVEVRDKNGTVIANSDKPNHANFVQFAIPKDGEYEVTVKALGTPVGIAGYRLISVGAGAELFDTFPHVLAANTMVNLSAQVDAYWNAIANSQKQLKVKR